MSCGAILLLVLCSAFTLGAALGAILAAAHNRRMDPYIQLSEMGMLIDEHEFARRRIRKEWGLQ